MRKRQGSFTLRIPGDRRGCYPPGADAGDSDCYQSDADVSDSDCYPPAADAPDDILRALLLPPGGRRAHKL